MALSSLSSGLASQRLFWALRPCKGLFARSISEPMTSVLIEAPAASTEWQGDPTEPWESLLPMDESTGGPMLCRYRKKHQKSTQLEERWWLEYDPPKANYISGQGRGPHGGNSIPKQNWPRQMVPIEYKKKWEKRERLRYAFRKHGYELDVPKLGG
ncbi:unnamed protein product [Effrenium voratum]|nr:unnamed protein product [Effrenium voratum]